jgi:hypothetical protein
MIVTCRPEKAARFVFAGLVVVSVAKARSATRPNLQ